MNESITLYYNGKIFTADDERPSAQAMIVKGRRILWAGDDADADAALAEEAAGPAARVDLGGRRVLPGFIDNHMHPVTQAQFSQQISVLPPAINSIEEMISAIREAREAMDEGIAASDPASCWIQGWGYNEGKFAEKRSTSRYDLDRGAGDVPVSIVRSCQHIRVVNSKALEICGIDADTPDPVGGEIDRDEQGEPTGILRENARLLVPPFIPEPDARESASMITHLGELLASQGITAIAELGSLDGTDNYELYRESIRQGLKQDIAMYYMWDSVRDDSRFTITKEQMAEGQQLRVCGLKILGDGSVSGHTAWMEEPYPGTDDYGVSTCTDDLLESAVAFCREHRCQLALHAMGRKTIRRFVDRLAGEEPWTEGDVPYVRLEHVTDPAPETIHKAAEAGIAWSTQPLFVFSEIESYLDNLGHEWTKRCYPVRSILEAGLPLSLSTDAPSTAWAVPYDPILNIRSAVTRRAYDGTDFGQEERIDIRTALRLYTSEAAKMIGLHDLGRIAPGFRASFIVLDEDILKFDQNTPAEEWDRVHVGETYINGECVYKRSESI